jgi:DNA-binding Xre family transcriptional regulator
MVGVRTRQPGRNASRASVPFWRTCRDCGNTLPLDDVHFAVTHRLTKARGSRQRFRNECRMCNVRKAREADKAMRTNPATREAYLAKRRAVNNRYLAEHPDKAEEYSERRSVAQAMRTREQKDADNQRKRERYERDGDRLRAVAREDYARNRAKRRQQLREAYARRKADPERWAHYRDMQQQWAAENRDRINENRRIWIRLRAEREGRDMRKSHLERKLEPLAVESLPVAPIQGFLGRLAERYGLTEAGAMASVDPTIVARIIKGEIASIRFDTADRICSSLNFNLFDFWPEA